MIHGITTMEELLSINAQNMHQLKFDLTADLESNLQIYRRHLSLEYLTGYLIEYALSVDNIFVIIMIFVSFGVEEKYYHKVLLWGILGAIVMRFIFIFLCSALIHKFSWLLAPIGGILLFMAIKMFLQRNKNEKIDIKKHPVVRFASKWFHVSDTFYKGHFFIKQNGKRLITPLFIVLLVIEFTDVIFAFDSVPAIFAITKDPYIVFFSNIFAILGLRSLFFLLINIMNLFHYLKTGLAALLAFIGGKMICHILFHIDMGILTSLLVIVSILAISIIASLLFPKAQKTDK